MRSVSRTRSARSGAGRSVVRPSWKPLPGTARGARPFVASRNLCTRRLAHALGLPRDHPRTRQTLPERLDKTFPAEPRNPHCRSSARSDPRARSRFESCGLAALAAATEQARRAAWCANCYVTIGRSSFLALCAVKRAPSSAARRCRVCGETRKRRPTRARPCDARGASGLRTARGLRALLGGPRSAFGVSSVSPRSARVLPPSFTCLRRRRRTASSHATHTRAVSCRKPPWAPERRLLKRRAEFQNTSGIPRLLAEFHAISVNSTLLRGFKLLSPISTRYQVEFANSNPDREFQPKTRIPRRLAPRGLGDVGRLVSLRAGARLKCSWMSRPSAWRLCSIAIFLHVACFLCSVCLEPFY